MVMPMVPPLGLSQLPLDEPISRAAAAAWETPTPPVSDSPRRTEALMTPALRAWVEALVDSRVQQVLPASGEDMSMSSWMVRTCHQGAEASALTAAALHQTEDSTRQLKAEVQSLAEAQERLLRLVDGLTGDAERQSNSTQWVRIEQLSNIQRVISSVDELQKAMGQEGEGVLSQVRQAAASLEELRRRQSEDFDMFRAELSDVKRLQSEAGHLQRNSGEELCAASAAVAELRREIQASQRALQRADEAARLEEKQLREGQQHLREQLEQLRAAQGSREQALEASLASVRAQCEDAREHMAARESRERQFLSLEKRLTHLEGSLEAAHEWQRSTSDLYELQVKSSTKFLDQQQEAFERRQAHLEGQTRELISREVEDQLQHCRKEHQLALKQLQGRMEEGLLSSEELSRARADSRKEELSKMDQRLRAVEELATNSDARCSTLARDFECRLTSCEATADGAVTTEELEAFARQLGEQLATVMRASRGPQQNKLVQQVREEVALQFQRLVESWDVTFREQLGSFEQQLAQNLGPRTHTLLRRQDLDVSVSSAAATEVPPEAAERMSKELDLFVGLDSSDAAKIFMPRSRLRMRA
eukprot:TRINITY_DN4112_c0_g1_i13.p1 TRINITY_DN4112_c0_g1~~TRINITY_DN4112_c0_g1_i13.p1  ORF type:complete len:593 (-),score=162.02 TRINITY_DN4112_c0_g1_i13:262-2040(-)